MARKKLVTQELVNKFPEWADVRRDEQSVGFSLINVLAGGLEVLNEEAYRGYHNLALTTANVGEIDQVYVFTLPNNFVFDVDDPTQLVPLELSPTVSGLINNTWYKLNEPVVSDIRHFWYEALPTRISLEVTTSGLNYSAPLLDGYTNEPTWELNQELDLPNRLLVRVTDGTEFFFEDKSIIRRARIRISGITWKGTNETEELVFLYNEDQFTNKVWKEITQVEAIDFIEAAHVQVYALSNNVGHYSDPYQDQHQYLESRSTMPRFWNLETTAPGLKTLVMEKLTGNTVDEVLANRSDKVPLRSWELVDNLDAPLDILDIQPIPYSRKCWGVTSTDLYLFDLDIDIPSTSLMKEKTSAPLVRIEASNDYPVRYEDVSVDFLFQRPIKDILRYRLKITYPDGAEYGVLNDGTLVAVSSNYWATDVFDSRFIRPTTFFEFDMFGYHTLTFEVEYTDGVIEVAQRVITVERKQALVSFDLTQIPWDIAGVALDHLQNLYVIDVNGLAHIIGLHYDVVLIDYQNKEIICREPYDMVKVLK